MGRGLPMTLVTGREPRGSVVGLLPNFQRTQSGAVLCYHALAPH